MNDEEQRKWQEQWKTTGEVVKTQINDRFDRMVDTLDKLDKGESKHKVVIEYDYVGFDPSKPGMSGSAQQR